MAHSYYGLIFLLISASLLHVHATNKEIETIKDQNLQSNFNSSIDGSQRRLDSAVNMKEIDTRQAADLPSWNFRTAEEEDMRKKYCNYPDDQSLKVVSRKEWKAAKQLTSEKRSQPAEFVIVDGHAYIIEGNDYIDNMQEEETHEVENFGNMICNFYIGDNGFVYEGLGWDYLSTDLEGGLGYRSLIVCFMKEDSDKSPSASAIAAYDELLEAAICNRRLSPRYILIPYYLISESFPLEKDSFEKNEMKKWNHYTDNLNSILKNIPDDDVRSPIVFKEFWNGIQPSNKLLNITFPIETVLVVDYGARCFTYNGCKQTLKVEEKSAHADGEELMFNFMIGEDGRAYEVFGWDKTWDETMNDWKVIDVGFFGTFYSYPPHHRALKAFQDLLNMGVSIGKISPDYKIMKYEVDDAPINDTKLIDEIRKMDRFG